MLWTWISHKRNFNLTSTKCEKNIENIQSEVKAIERVRVDFLDRKGEIGKSIKNSQNLLKF